jgi:hypothetical protein
MYESLFKGKKQSANTFFAHFPVKADEGKLKNHLWGIC